MGHLTHLLSHQAQLGRRTEASEHEGRSARRPAPPVVLAFTLVSMPRGEPPPPDGVDAFWIYTAALGIEGGRLRALDEQLNADFRAAEWGYAPLGVLPRPQRAVVSDQILVGAQGVIRNLAEARLHEHDVNELLAGGVTYAENTPEAHERVPA
jgi:hypothetical protein